MADTLASRLSGRILIAVEARGEAWYVDPGALTRYYLGRPTDAWKLMRRLGLGVSNRDFAAFHDLGPGRLAGRILLKVEDLGKAYYVNPLTRRLVYLGSPADAFAVMRRLGLGVNNADLKKIPTARDSATPPGAPAPSYDLLSLEQSIFNLVNAEREKGGLKPVIWNDGIARVAREHSEGLAQENQGLVDSHKLCGYPFIHHEGNIFGLYHYDRLNNRGVYNLSASAENIALVPLVKQTYYLSEQNQLPLDCQARLDELNQSYEARVKATSSQAGKLELVSQELSLRRELFNQSPNINLTREVWQATTEAASETVAGWMASPGHRANILTAEYTDAGLGAARVKDYLIITQLFMKRADCGYMNGPCCQKAGYYPYCFIPLNCNVNLCQ